MKFCKDCGQTRPFSEWQRWTRGKDGLQKRCRVCMNKRVRANRHYSKATRQVRQVAARALKRYTSVIAEVDALLGREDAT